MLDAFMAKPPIPGAGHQCSECGWRGIVQGRAR